MGLATKDTRISHRFQPEEHFICVRDIRLHYVDWGNNGPPLLMLHGDMRTCRSWDAVARALYTRFHIISLDARGHGDSDWTPTGYKIRERVEDLAAFCRHLGIQHALGVGHSTGGAVIAFCAQQQPGVFDRLVIMEPIVVLDDSFHREVAPRARQPRHTWSSRQELFEYLKQHESARRWREDVIWDVANHEARQLPDGSLDMKWAPETFNWEERRGDSYDLKPLFWGLGLPVLFIASGEYKHWSEELSSPDFQVAGVQRVVLERSGHNMYMEQPEAVSQLIEAFYRSQPLPTVI